MKRYLPALTLFLALLPLKFSLASSISVSGNVSGMWSVDTVFVDGEVRVPPSENLTIEPHVRVLFRANVKFIVDNGATLLAVGTVSDTIHFDRLLPNTTWRGIRLLSASSNTRLEYCRIRKATASGSGQDQLGGGIYCYNTSPTITKCRIDSCSAFWGGGICCNNAHPTISYCQIVGNTTTGSNNYGGGICLYNYAHPNIQNNTISDNSAQSGGGIYCYDYTTPVLQYNIINENYASAEGGGIYCGYNSEPEITYNTISSNSAWNGAGIWTYYCDSNISYNTITDNIVHTVYGDGGGLCLWYSNATVRSNLITNNFADDNGGGIFCHTSSPNIGNNTITDNYANTAGGGIYCYYYSAPQITNNLISGNEAGGGSGKGGGIYSENVYSVITWNTISLNSASSSGGGIYCNSNPTITDNTISQNTSNLGGGIYCNNATATIATNLIKQNIATGTQGHGGGLYSTAGYSDISNNIFRNNSSNYGGALYALNSSPSVRRNTIFSNVSSYGGAIYNNNSNSSISNNTIAHNSAAYFGGIMSTGSNNPVVINNILWENTYGQVYVNITASVQYCDIQGGWPGTGNLNSDPLFVKPEIGDYRLEWGSPCIDAGNPSSNFNDPDSTRSDIGALYLDQSMPIRVLTIPDTLPILFPPSGGTISYDIELTNLDTIQRFSRVWFTLMHPNYWTEALSGPFPIGHLDAGEIRLWAKELRLPASYSAGEYVLKAYSAAGADTVWDSFSLTKQAALGDEFCSDWINFGAERQPQISDTPTLTGSRISINEQAPQEFILYDNYPNPFNAVTAISYQLSAFSSVSLRVYDTAGRLVATLVDGWRENGRHEVIWDATNFPAGIYFARLTAGDFSEVQKLVLLK